MCKSLCKIIIITQRKMICCRSKRSDLQSHPAAKRTQCPLLWSHLVSVTLPPLYLKMAVMRPVAERLWQGVQGVTPGSGTKGSGGKGRSEGKHSLSLRCHWGRDALCVCVRLRPQDKNVFDIACNCVMFTLLVSEGACIGKQELDCRSWWGEAFLPASRERQQEV